MRTGMQFHRRIGKKVTPRSKGDLRRQQLLHAIEQLTSSRSGYPTLEEIQAITGIRSFDTVTRHLKLLEREGLIEWINHSPKTVKILKETKEA